MMDTLLYIFVIYPLGIFIGFVSFTMVWMPLLVGIPMAVYWSLRGCVRYKSIFSYIPGTIFGLVLLTLVGFFFLKVLPIIGEDNGFYIAQTIGSLFALLICFKKTGRYDIQCDFWKKMIRSKYIREEHPLALEKLEFVLTDELGETEAQEILRQAALPLTVDGSDKKLLRDKLQRLTKERDERVAKLVDAMKRKKIIK